MCKYIYERNEIVDKIIEPCSIIKVATHNGKWHADEMVAISILKGYLKEFWGGRPVKIVRTRTEEGFAGCQFVLDVGKMDLITDTQIRLDHHQNEKKFYEKGIQYATCGKLADLMMTDWGHNKLCENGLFSLQAKDNGQRFTEDNLINCRELTDPFTFVRRTNPIWSEKNVNLEEKFHDALRMVEFVYNNLVKEIDGLKEADRIMENVYMAISKNEKVLVLPYYIKGWQKTVISKKKEYDVQYVIYPTLEKDEYNLELSPVNTKKLAWKDKQEGMTFLHKNGYMATFDNLDHAKKAVNELIKECA